MPTDNTSLGETAKLAEPFVRQVFHRPQRRHADWPDDMAFERKLYVIRKRVEQAIRYTILQEGNRRLYIASLSSRTSVYKGMLLAEQVDAYYSDLADRTRRVGDRRGAFAL